MMLILNNADTPKGTLNAVLEFIQEEAARYREQAASADRPSTRAVAQGKVNALLTIHMQIADCNVAQIVERATK